MVLVLLIVQITSGGGVGVGGGDVEGSRQFLMGLTEEKMME